MFNQRPPSIRERMARFMSGRRGSDTLNNFLIGECITIAILNLFLEIPWLVIIELAILFYAFFRFMSRNVYKREKENARFVEFFKAIKNFFVLRKNKIRDRKTHIYKKCPGCKSVLRLPRSRGEHTVRCPRCSERFDITIK